MPSTLFPELAPAKTAAIVGPYRYELGRSWGDGPAVNWIMLNPSTAGGTIRLGSA